MELQFYSPEGMPLDTLIYEHLVSPASAILENGLFASFQSFESNEQVLLWIDNQGSVVIQDTLDLHNLNFCYALNNQVQLIEQSADLIGSATLRKFVKHSFSADGQNLGSSLLYQDTLAETELVSANAYDFTDEFLTIAAISSFPAESPVRYSVKLIHHTPQNIEILPSWDPGPLPIGAYAYAWAVASAPWGNGVLGFNLQSDNSSEFWFQTYDSEGQPTRLLQTVPLTAGENVNGLDILVSHETVYSLFTTFTGGEDVEGGAWMVGFPLENILSIDVNYSPIPDKISIYAYPNPFNSVINFEFSFTSSNLSDISIYNTEGRKVGVVYLKQNQHKAVWTPNNLASGTYFAKLVAGDQVFTQKLILLK